LGGRLRQEDHEFEASLVYIVRLCLKKKTNKQNEKQQQKATTSHSGHILDQINQNPFSKYIFHDSMFNSDYI
jgi:hypothetical protein